MPALLLVAKAAQRAVAASGCDAEVSKGVYPLEARVTTYRGGYVSTPIARNASISCKAVDFFDSQDFLTKLKSSDCFNIYLIE